MWLLLSYWCCKHLPLLKSWVTIPFRNQACFLSSANIDMCLMETMFVLFKIKNVLKVNSPQLAWILGLESIVRCVVLTFYSFFWLLKASIKHNGTIHQAGFPWVRDTAPVLKRNLLLTSYSALVSLIIIIIFSFLLLYFAIIFGIDTYMLGFFLCTYFLILYVNCPE